MKRVRFAPSPTGSLHVGGALSALANRRLGDWFLLRIDDTDAARNVPGGEEGILRDLEWLGIEWDEGPVRASSRAERHREAARELPQRFDGVMLWRDDGSPTYHLASVVDDGDFGITHVVRGNDHRPNEDLHRKLHAALGTEPPEYVHHGLILGDDGKKLAKRAEGGSVAALREAGIPAEAVVRYLEQLGIPKHDVHYDLPRIKAYAVDVLTELPDDELAARLGIPARAVPLARGAHDLAEAKALVDAVLSPPSNSLLQGGKGETLARFRELRERANGGLDLAGAKALLREVKAVGGDLRALRVALTGRDRGPELAAVVAALDRDETLRRLDAAL